MTRPHRCLWHGEGCSNHDCRDSGRWVTYPDPDPLHQQAEALAKQIADRLNNHWADDTSVPDVIALIVPVLQDLRERVQAETREEDAKDWFTKGFHAAVSYCLPYLSIESAPGLRRSPCPKGLPVTSEEQAEALAKRPLG